MLIDNHQRTINYLRLAVTDRCNLRCFYCMPVKGIKYVKREDLLSYEEMYRIIRVLSEEGISKIRITGGEPFVRKGILEFLEDVSSIDKIKEINITTNGTSIGDKISKLERIGINSVNLSLDTLDKQRFIDITRRDEFDQVFSTYHKLVESSIRVKINMVVMDGRNTQDIYSMLELTKDADVSVRFIEEMPFNGTLGQGNETFWPMNKILGHVKEKYHVSKLVDAPYSTSTNYQIDGYKGSFGIIAAFTRTFCGTCNRIRLTPQGVLKTCLYDNGVMSVRDLIRTGITDSQLVDYFKKALNKRAIDGFEAEKNRNMSRPVSESMATIGG